MVDRLMNDGVKSGYHRLEIEGGMVLTTMAMLSTNNEGSRTKRADFHCVFRRRVGQNIMGQRKFKMRNEDRTNSYGEKLDIDEIQKIQILTPSLPPFPNVCH